jgi:DNA-binding transcriptional ArsR family regulator
MTNSPANWLPMEALELVASRFRVLGEGSRLRLLAALRNQERTVSELVTLTGLTQANVSRHLNLMAEAGILGRRKDGLNVYYFVGEPAVFALCERVCGHLQRKFDAGTSALAAAPAPVSDEVIEHPGAKKPSRKIRKTTSKAAEAGIKAVPAESDGEGTGGFAVTFD